MKPNNTNQNRPLQVALIANLKENFTPESHDPPDAGAEFDKLETVNAIIEALESDGHSVILIEADHTLPQRLYYIKPDICFNIAEGLKGEGREAQVPAVCEILDIPYTGSRIVANAISLDKVKTKHIWQNLGLPVAPFCELNSTEITGEINLNFPLIVKPAREGTGMGIDSSALVNSLDQLKERAAWVINTYKEPALVEEYLPGREFTVGYIGNPGNPDNRVNHDLYEEDGYHWFPVLEINNAQSITPGIYGHSAKDLYMGESGAPEYLCPAEISEELRSELIYLTRRAAEAIDACDVSRVDFRIGKDGKPYLMEINTLPGLNPLISDLCIMAAAEGIEYTALINEILYLACDRYEIQVSAGETAIPRNFLSSAVEIWKRNAHNNFFSNRKISIS
jgi:D-alanine-D-alanine ligase